MYDTWIVLFRSCTAVDLMKYELILQPIVLGKEREGSRGSLRFVLLNDTWSCERYSVSCITILFSVIANHHVKFHTESGQSAL